MLKERWMQEERGVLEKLPGQTRGLQGRGASPRRAQQSHIPATTCLWLHKKAGQE